MFKLHIVSLTKKPLTRILLALLLVLAINIGSIPGMALAGDWPQFQSDAANGGETGDAGAVDSVTKGWKAYTAAASGSGIDTTPIIGDGKVFALSVAGKVYAFDLATGVSAWSRDLGSSATFSFELATPCYAEGNLYVAKQDGEVWALDGGTGATVWGPVQLGDVSDQLNTPVTYADGKIYVGSASGNRTYYCLDTVDGSTEWSRSATHGKGYYWAGACVAGDYLIFGDDDGWLTSVNKATGALADEEDLKTVEPGAGNIRSAVSYDAGTGRVYLTDQGGWCWAYTFEPATGALTYQWHTAIGWSTSTPAVHNGRVYVGSGNFGSAGSLHCLYESDGVSDWAFTPPNGGGIESSPAVSTQGDSAHIYFTSNCTDGAVYCVDEAGNQVWEYVSEEAGGSAGYVLQGTAVAEGFVCFGNDGGYLYALREAYQPWDVNRDGFTNAADIGLIGLKWMQSGTPGWIPEDVNGDGYVNAADIGIVGLHWME